ncbi:MAG TPA: type II secretion system protein [Candidatus Saccharimonadales bacterium]
MKRNASKKGFTLIELLLAMTFISILLVMIATLTLQVSKIYNKGLTLRAVDQAGQLISSEIQRKLNQADPTTVHFIKIQDGGKPSGGRLCIGRDVYAWNFTDYIEGVGATAQVNRYQDSSTNVRFVKVNGDEKYCVDQDPSTPDIANVTGLPYASQARDLLAGGDADLVLRSFKIEPADVLGDGSQKIYHVTFIIGTRTADLIDSNDTCVPPAGGGDEYCAVNKFDFTARAGGNDD